MYSLWFYILIIIIWKNDSKVLQVRLIVWYISNEKIRNTGWGYSSTVYPISFVWLGGIYKHDLYHPMLCRRGNFLLLQFISWGRNIWTLCFCQKYQKLSIEVLELLGV